MKTTRGIKLFVIALGLLILPLFAQSVRADNVDFACGPTTCTGTVTTVAGDTSTTGISVFNDSGPYSSSTAFTLTFDTTAGTIELNDGSGDVLQGKIYQVVSGSGATTSSIDLYATWWGLPSVVQSFLGTPTGIDSAFAIYLNGTGAAQSVDVLITPTPEPGTLLLFGTGMLLCAGLLRRRRQQVSVNA